MKQNETQKILFDTDIGSDIDDAVALAWLLANPLCELVGITTVSGRPVKRAKLASVLCKIAGKDIPIIPGTAKPLRVEPRQPTAQQASSLERWPHQQSFSDEDVIDFMANLITRNPGEITLLAVGPMTNVALLFERHPEAQSQLKQIMLMGGRFGSEQIGQRAAEWNMFCDPHAGDVVINTLNTGATRMRSVGLDVTTQVQMDAEEVRRRFKVPLLEPVLDMAEEWFSRRPQITFHDPLAAVMLFDDELCKFERGVASVDLDEGPTIGTTRWQASDDGPLEVGVEVDPDLFFERYFEVFEG